MSSGGRVLQIGALGRPSVIGIIHRRATSAPLSAAEAISKLNRVRVLHARNDHWERRGTRRAWREDSKDGETPYLAFRLDDPSFAKPLRAAFFENEKDATGVMVWNRPKAA